jgi:tetratricopeptide (TPR) repeat protein
MRERTVEGKLKRTGCGFVVFCGRWLLLLGLLAPGVQPAALAQDSRPSPSERNGKSGASASKPVRRPVPVNPAASSASSPEQAVVFDESYHAPAKDLLLNLESERKADAAAHYLQGVLLEEAADNEKAAEQYLKALSLNPGNVELSNKLAWRYAAQGKSAEAIGLLKDSIKALPKRPEPYLALAYLYFKVLDKSDLAQKYATQALDIDPNNFLVYQTLKEIYAASNQSQKIGPLLDRAAKSDRKEPAYWLRVGGLYAEFYLKGEAAKNPESLKKTTAIFQKALSLANNDPEIVVQVADFYAESLQVTEAIPLYRKVIEVEPSMTSARENLARCYLASDQRDKAVAELEALIKINPVQQHAYELLGRIYEDAKDIDKAMVNYEQSLLISPNQKDNYERLGLLLLNAHKLPEKAVAILTEARRRFPNEPRFSYWLAAALGEAKLEAQNSQPALINSEFLFLYGATAEQANLYDKAAPLLKKSLELEDDPKLIARTSNYLGYMYVDHSISVEEGGNLIRRALEIEPDSGAYRDSLGWYYYRTGKFDKALVELTRAAELMREADPIKPEDPVVLEHIGDTYQQLKDTANAVNCWQKAMALDPANPNNPALAKKIESSKAQLTQGPPPPSEASAAPDGKPR